MHALSPTTKSLREAGDTSELTSASARTAEGSGGSSATGKTMSDSVGLEEGAYEMHALGHGAGWVGHGVDEDDDDDKSVSVVAP